MSLNAVVIAVITVIVIITLIAMILIAMNILQSNSIRNQWLNNMEHYNISVNATSNTVSTPNGASAILNNTPQPIGYCIAYRTGNIMFYSCPSESTTGSS